MKALVHMGGVYTDFLDMSILSLEAGQPPVYDNFPEPAPSERENHIIVTAASLSHATRGRS